MLYTRSCGPETPKRVFWQIVKNEMNYRIMRHFIRVCTVCYMEDKIILQRKRYNNSLEIMHETCDSSIYIMDHADSTLSNFMGYFIGIKGLISTYT